MSHILAPVKTILDYKGVHTSFTSFRGGMCFWTFKGINPTLRGDAGIEVTAWPQSVRAVISIDIELPRRAKQSVEMSREAFEAIGKALGYNMTREG